MEIPLLPEVIDQKLITQLICNLQFIYFFFETFNPLFSLAQKKFLCFNFSSCTREALERKSWQRWPKRWAFSECRQGIFVMPFFGHAFFLSKVRSDFMKIQNAWIKVFRSFSSRVENAFSDLRMPFRRFLQMPPSRIRNASQYFENASQRIENASHTLRMLFEELKMLLTLWECFSKNWKMLLTLWECFSKN